MLVNIHILPFLETLVTDIHFKQMAADADVLRQEFCISGLKIHRSKTKKWKEKVQQNTQLSFGGGREAFHQEIVLRRIQSRASDKANIFTFQPLMSF